MGDRARANPLRRLDHVAVAVRDTELALRHFRDRLGLAVVSSEYVMQPPVRLTYLDCGNCLLQLVEPLREDSPIASFLDEHGEGLHHVCFAVDDVEAALGQDGGSSPSLGSGRGRISAFVPGEVHGTRIEVTEFHRETDVDRVRGWLG